MLLALAVALSFVVVAFANTDDENDATPASSDESTTKVNTLPPFLADIIEFFQTYLVDAIRNLIARIAESIGGPSLPWANTPVPTTVAP